MKNDEVGSADAERVTRGDTTPRGAQHPMGDTMGSQ
jgi:hypothetical protein